MELKPRTVRHVYGFSGGITEDADLYPEERERNAEQRGFDKGWNAALEEMKREERRRKIERGRNGKSA